MSMIVTQSETMLLVMGVLMKSHPRARDALQGAQMDVREGT